MSEEYTVLGKKLAHVLAEEWGLKPGTVSDDLSQGFNLVKDSMTAEDAAVWRRGMNNLVSVVAKDIADVQSMVDALRDADGRIVDQETRRPVGPLDIKSISEALSKPKEMLLRVAEQLGKATGAIQSGTTINLSVDIDGTKVRAQAQELAQYAKALTDILLASGDPGLIDAVRQEMRRLGPGQSGSMGAP